MDHMNNTLIPERLKSAREQLNLSKVLYIKRKRNMIFHTSQSFEQTTTFDYDGVRL